MHIPVLLSVKDVVTDILEGIPKRTTEQRDVTYGYVLCFRASTVRFHVLQVNAQKSRETECMSIASDIVVPMTGTKAWYHKKLFNCSRPERHSDASQWHTNASALI